MDVKIFGRIFKVHCPKDRKESLQRAVNSLNQRLEYLKVKTGVVNTEQLIFVTALNIFCELEHEKYHTKMVVSKLEKKLLELHKKLESIL